MRSKTIFSNLHLALFFIGGALLGLGNAWGDGEALHIIANISVIVALLVMLANIFTRGAGAMLAPGGLMLFILALFYFYTTAVYSVPTIDAKNISHPISLMWWIQYGKMGLSALVIGVSAHNNKQTFAAILGFCICCFFIAVGFISFTIITTGEAVYGKMSNPLTGLSMSSPGMMSLIVFLPSLMAGIVLSSEKNLRIITLPALVLTYFFASLAGYFYASRSVFIILLVVIPSLALGIYLLKTKLQEINKIVLSLALFLGGGFIMLALHFLRRPVEGNIVHDLRIQMMASFFSQVSQAPFAHPTVPLAMQAATTVHYFHNFFADAYRLSGPFCFLAALLLVVTIGARVFMLSLTQRSGVMMIVLFFVTLSILLSSVVPEGEFQPLLLLLLIGGTTETLLRLKSIEKA
jgi:hypothetical protein